MTTSLRPPAPAQQGNRPSRGPISKARRERLRVLRASREPEPAPPTGELRDSFRLYFAQVVQHAAARVIQRQGVRVLADALRCSETSARRLVDDATPLTDRLLALVWLDPSTDTDERLGDALVALGRAVVRWRDEHRGVPTSVPWGAS